MLVLLATAKSSARDVQLLELWLWLGHSLWPQPVDSHGRATATGSGIRAVATGHREASYM